MTHSARRWGKALFWVTLVAVLPLAALLACSSPSDDRHFDLLHHDLQLRIVPDEHRLIATDRMTLKVLRSGLRRIELSLSAALRVSSIHVVDGTERRPLPFQSSSASSDSSPSASSSKPMQHIHLTLDPPADVGHVLTVEWAYAGVINDPPQSSRHLRFVTPSQTSGHIGNEGVYVSSETHWYPDAEGALATYTVEVTLPEGWVAVTHGREVSRTMRDGTAVATWDVESKTEALTLVANRFVKRERDWKGIEISAYLFPDDVHLADEYLDATARYLKVYTKLLGPYPFPKFAVVENFFPAGLGMPSFTLLGSRVIKRHYVQPYALGHEIVHSWLGNSVLNDFTQGNWVEGLTTYLANYYYHELTGTAHEAWKERRHMFLGYAVHVWPEEDYPIASFGEKTDQKDNAIGYQKTAMVFHMLRREIGDEAFWSGLRHVVARYTGAYASWQDLEEAFGSAADRDLRWFFAQWIERAGAPTVALVEATADAGVDTGGFRITGRVRQAPGDHAYRLRLPVLVTMEGGRTHGEVLEVQGPDEPFTLSVPGRPIRLQIDPDLETFRRLPRRSLPPILNLYVTDRARSLIVPTGGSDAERQPYEALAQRIASREEGKEIKQATELDTPAKQGSVLILGGPDLNPAVGWAAQGCGEGVKLGSNRFSVGGETYAGAGMALLISCRHPERPEHVVTIFYGLSPGAAATVARLLFFYGWQSYVVFRDGAVVTRGDFAPEASALEVRFDAV